MKKYFFGVLFLITLILSLLFSTASASSERENINQDFDTTGYGSYIKVYLNKKDSMYNPVNTMSIINTGKLHVKFNYMVTESGKGPLRVELRGYTSDVTTDNVNPYWEGWQYDSTAAKLTPNTEYSFDAILDTKALSDGKTVQDGPYLFIGGVGSTIKVTNLELYAEGTYDKPVYILDKMSLQPTNDAEIPCFEGEIYELTPERYDVARTQHRIATYKNVYDFIEGTNYTVTFWYKTGANGNKFALDTTGDISEATGWKNVGNYEIEAGTEGWQKGCLAFTCSADLAANDRLYLSYNLSTSSNEPGTDYIYVTDMILYEVPTEIVTYGNGFVDKDVQGGPVISFSFNGVPDKVSIINGLLLNGQILNEEDVELLSVSNDDTIELKVKKFIPPLSENTITLSSCYDVYGREIELVNPVNFVFTANPYISNEVTYYDISSSELQENPKVITELNSAEKIRAKFILKNNTDEEKKCYIVNMLISDGIVKAVYAPFEVIISAGDVSTPVHIDNVDMQTGDVLRTFYWSTIDKDLRAFNLYSEFK